MSSNQREIQRKDKRAEKERKTKKIIWVTIAVVIVILAVMRIFEFNVNSVKERFTDEEGKFSISEGVESTNFPYSIDASENVVLKNINNKICVLTPTTYTVLDSKNATVDYTFDHGFSNPVLVSSGIYSLIYDQGQNHYRLDTTSDAVYSEASENKILCADVSKGGTAVIATTSSKKLCEFNVYNKSLKNTCNIQLSEGYIIDIAISADGRKVAAAVVSSDNANLITKIFMYDVSKQALASQTDLPGGNVADIRFSGSALYVVGDTYAGVVRGGEYKPSYEQGDIVTEYYDYTASGELVLAFGGYTNSTENKIALIRPNGKVKRELDFNGVIKDISASGNVVSILTGNSVTGLAMSNGEVREELATDDSTKSICRIGSVVYMQRQSTIDRSDLKND